MTTAAAATRDAPRTSHRLRRPALIGTTMLTEPSSDPVPPSTGDATGRSLRPSPGSSRDASRSHDGATALSSWAAIPSHSPTGDSPPELASRPATS